MATFRTLGGNQIDLTTVSVEVGLVIQDILNVFDECRSAAATASHFVTTVREILRRRFPSSGDHALLLNGPAGEVFRDCAHRLHLREQPETEPDRWSVRARFNPVRVLFEQFVAESISQAEFARQSGLSPSTLSSAFRFLREWGQTDVDRPAEPRMTLETFARACEALGVTLCGVRTAKDDSVDVPATLDALLCDTPSAFTVREAALLQLCGVVGRLLSEVKTTSQSRTIVTICAFHVSLLFGVSDEILLARLVEDVLRAFTPSATLTRIQNDVTAASIFGLGLGVPMGEGLPVPSSIASDVAARFTSATINLPFALQFPDRAEGHPSREFCALMERRWRVAEGAALVCAERLCPPEVAQQGTTPRRARRGIKLDLKVTPVIEQRDIDKSFEPKTFEIN